MFKIVVLASHVTSPDILVFFVCCTTTYHDVSRRTCTMSSSEEDEGRPLLNASVDARYQEMTADDDLWLSDTVPSCSFR